MSRENKFRLTSYHPKLSIVSGFLVGSLSHSTLLAQPLEQATLPVTTNSTTRAHQSLSPPAPVVRAGPRVVQLQEGGKIWITEDPAILVPSLTVGAPSSVALANGTILEPIAFSIYTNYAAFVHHAEIRIFDASDVDLTRPAAVLPVRFAPGVNTASLSWSGELPALQHRLREGERLTYVLRVFDEHGRWDETLPQYVRLLSEQERQRELARQRSSTTLQDQFASQASERSLESYLVDTEQYGANALAIQNINLSGSRVTVRGQALPVGTSVMINGVAAPLTEDGQLLVEYVLPIGRHRFSLDIRDGVSAKRYQRQLEVDITGKYFFLVGLADLTLSKTGATGNIDAISEAEAARLDKIQTDGRLAFYLKGKIQGKYLLTAHADTQERPLDQMFSGFFKADAQDLFRRIDPDAYYPVYGDDSTSFRDVDTQGRMYVRLDWDKNQVLWGNFNTDYNETQLAQFNRGLYGASVNLDSDNVTPLGESRTQLRLFGSQQQTAPGHNEFLGTGGSLYYLRNTDILPGSEQVSVVTRDQLSGRQLNALRLVPGRDYEIDAFQGRLLLSRPLQQIASDSGRLTQDVPLGGDSQYLVVDYEYYPSGFESDNLVSGLRGKQWLNDHVAVGGTFVQDKRDGEDYQLAGGDITLQAGKGTYLKIEHAPSRSKAASLFSSDNGGLSFRESLLNDDVSGAASSMEARANFKELGWSANEWWVKVWGADKDAGFSNSRTEHAGYDTRDMGVELAGRVSENVIVTAGHQDAAIGRGEQRRRERLNADWEYGEHQHIAAEVQQVSDELDEVASEATLAGVRVSNRIAEETDVYVGAQSAMRRRGYGDNDGYSVGVKREFTDATVGLEYSDGDRGSAVSALAEYRRTPDHTLYGTVTHAPEGEEQDELFGSSLAGRSGGVTVGQSWQLSQRTRMRQESQWLNSRRERGVLHGSGVDFMPSPGWSLGVNLQKGQVTTAEQGGELERRAVSVSGGYTDSLFNWSSKLEYRDDKGRQNQHQWVTANRLGYKLDEAWRVSGRANYAITHDDDTGSIAARLMEFGMGAAYRPTNLRWNALGKYTYFYDLASPGQDATRHYNQRSHVVSLEGTYEWNEHWDFAAKLAHRISMLNERDTGQWFRNHATMPAVQARYHLGDRGSSGSLWQGWSVMGEYRWLTVSDDGQRKGVLLSVDKDINKHFRVGVGYNFSDFSADLTDLDYRQQGLFINVVGRF